MKYFIDTNIIIDLLKKDKEAQRKIKAILLEEDSEIYINRLVSMESLRTIHNQHTKKFREAKETLDSFEQQELTPKIYEQSIDFSRYCHSKGIRLKGRCEAIDFLHFMTAKYYNLKLVTNDGDFNKLDMAYREYMMEKID